MNSRWWFRSFQIIITLCGRLCHTTTESWVNTTPINGEVFRLATPAQGGSEVVSPTNINAAEEVTPQPTVNSTMNTTLFKAATVVTEVPFSSTVQPVATLQGNVLLPQRPVKIHNISNTRTNNASPFLLNSRLPLWSNPWHLWHWLLLWHSGLWCC